MAAMALSPEHSNRHIAPQTTEPADPTTTADAHSRQNKPADHSTPNDAHAPTGGPPPPTAHLPNNRRRPTADAAAA